MMNVHKIKCFRTSAQLQSCYNNTIKFHWKKTVFKININAKNK